MYKITTAHAIAGAWLLWGLSTTTAMDAKAQDPFWASDKAVHLAASTVLAIGGYAVACEPVAEPWQRGLLALGFSFSAGLAKEAADAAGFGHPSASDLAWNLIGATAGALVAIALDTAVPPLYPLSDHVNTTQTGWPSHKHVDDLDWEPNDNVGTPFGPHLTFVGVAGNRKSVDRDGSFPLWEGRNIDSID